MATRIALYLIWLVLILLFLFLAERAIHYEQDQGQRPNVPSLP
jgi:hypothetical protein